MAKHSYEEIRAITCDILAGREKTTYDNNQFRHLELGVAEVLKRKDIAFQQLSYLGHHGLPPDDAMTFSEVFWDLFRQGIITIGCDSANNEFPFFRLSRHGKAILENQQTYFFHDVTSYENMIRKQLPHIDDTTIIYLKESMQAFRTGCILSATVMLGVASENQFESLLDTIKNNPKHEKSYSAIHKERSILNKFNKFCEILKKHMHEIPDRVKEDLDVRLYGILSIIRQFRNESGHPTGKIIDRELAYVLLNLFPTYAAKIDQLRSYFAEA